MESILIFKPLQRRLHVWIHNPSKRYCGLFFNKYNEYSKKNLLLTYVVWHVAVTICTGPRCPAFWACDRFRTSKWPSGAVGWIRISARPTCVRAVSSMPTKIQKRTRSHRIHCYRPTLLLNPPNKIKLFN